MTQLKFVRDSYLKSIPGSHVVGLETFRYRFNRLKSPDQSSTSCKYKKLPSNFEAPRVFLRSRTRHQHRELEVVLSEIGNQIRQIALQASGRFPIG